MVVATWCVGRYDWCVAVQPICKRATCSAWLVLAKVQEGYLKPWYFPGTFPPPGSNRASVVNGVQPRLLPRWMGAQRAGGRVGRLGGLGASKACCA